MRQTLTILSLLASCWSQAAEYTFSSTGGEHGWWDTDAWTLDSSPTTWDNGGSTTAPENTVRFQSDTTQTISIDQDVYLQGIDIIGTSGGQGTVLQGSTGSETIHLGTGSIALHATSGNRLLKFNNITVNILDGATSTWNLAPSAGGWLVFGGSTQLTGTGKLALNFGSAGYTLTLAATNGNNQVNASGFTGEIQLQRGSLNINQAFAGNVSVASCATSTVSVGASGSFANKLILGEGATVCLNLNATGSFTGTIQKGSNSTIQLAGTVNGNNLALAERGDFFNGNSNLTIEAGAENVVRSITTTSSASGYIVMNSQSDSQTQYIDITLNNNNNNQGDLILTETFIGKEAHIGNLAGDAANAQVRVDWGGNTVGEEARMLVVHQTQDATFAGKFTTNAKRTSALTKRGQATLTLSGNSTTPGLLRVAEGRVNLTGSWVGTAQIDDGTMLEITGTLGSASTGHSYVVAEQGQVTLKDSGTIRNSGVELTAAPTSRNTGAATQAVLKNVTVTTDGIARTSSSGRGTIENGHIAIKQTEAFNIGSVLLKDTLVDLQAAGSVTLNNVVIGAGTTLSHSGGGTLSIIDSSLVLSSGNIVSPPVAPAAGSPLELTYSMAGASITGNFTLDITTELLRQIGGLSGGPMTEMQITLTDVTAWDNVSLATGSEFDKLGATADTSGLTGGNVVINIHTTLPIPEPATATLGLLGLSSLLLRRRRKA